MPAIHEMIPDPEALSAMGREERGLVVLKYIISGSASNPGTPSSPIHPHNVFSSGATPGAGYPPEFVARANEALKDGWAWLENEGLLLPATGHGAGWVYVSDRGRDFATRGNIESYKFGQMFPRRLHHAINPNAFAQFVRGEYGTVIFEAYRAIEVSVRNATASPLTLVGVDLMRKAFAPGSGPLTDSALPVAEQEATAHLFAGAIGLFKNPSSHRLVAVTNPQDVVALLMFADYLLRLVDERVSARKSAAGVP
jgi:uncharacterized protein (TIGR02391 family)